MDEFDVVELTKEKRVGSVTYPIGSQGTIVYVHGDHEAYEVELAGCVITLMSDEIHT